MTNSMWVTLLYFFDRQSHQSCFIPWPTGSEWHCFISLPGSLINHVSSHGQQAVSDTALFLCQAVSSIMFHQNVGHTALLFARQSHQSCFIPWPTESEWLCFMSLSGSLINHVSPYNQQGVSDMPYFFARQSHQSCFIPWPTESELCCLFLCQAVSLIMFHPLTNREWVRLLCFFTRQSHGINHASFHHQ